MQDQNIGMEEALADLAQPFRLDDGDDDDDDENVEDAAVRALQQMQKSKSAGPSSRKKAKAGSGLLAQASKSPDHSFEVHPEFAFLHGHHTIDLQLAREQEVRGNPARPGRGARKSSRQELEAPSELLPADRFVKHVMQTAGAEELQEDQVRLRWERPERFE